uniref:Helix-turn-helix domain-containing protein n=1 Tax=Desulfobacca acetoxidans TaxID=60893 RepID=A0A7V6A390_9BACT
MDTIPWKEVYPQFNASLALRGARKREGLTQKDLALSPGVKQSHISEMERGLTKRRSGQRRLNFLIPWQEFWPVLPTGNPGRQRRSPPGLR